MITVVSNPGSASVFMSKGYNGTWPFNALEAVAGDAADTVSVLNLTKTTTSEDFFEIFEVLFSEFVDAFDLPIGSTVIETVNNLNDLFGQDAEGGSHVNVSNDKDIIYVKGDDTTDGSVRFVINQGGVPKVESRKNGVWNPGALEVGRNTLLLGQDTSISAAHHHIIVQAQNDDIQEIAIGTPYADAGSEQPHATMLGQRLNRVVVQGDNSLDLVQTTHTGIDFLVASAFFHNAYFQTGAVGATDDVTVEFTEGVPPDDHVFFSQKYNAGVFPADTEVILDTNPGVIFPSFAQINLLISSSNAFSMKFNAAGTEFWLATDFQFVTDEFVLTLPTGFNHFLSDSSGSLIVDNSGNMLASTVEHP